LAFEQRLSRFRASVNLMTIACRFVCAGSNLPDK
jgi:hypothetical protein